MANIGYFPPDATAGRGSSGQMLVDFQPVASTNGALGERSPMDLKLGGGVEVLSPKVDDLICHLRYDGYCHTVKSALIITSRVGSLKVRSHIHCAVRRSAACVELVTAALRCALLPVASTNNVFGYSAL